MTEGTRLAVVGLGYVGLPVALAFQRQFPGTLGFDEDAARVAALAAGIDRNGEVPEALLRASGLRCTADARELALANVYVIAVPTPIDGARRPDLGPLRRAAATVGAHLAPGDIAILESTVYPGLTEEVLGPLLEQASGLSAGRDFHLAYSPERINPGDREHTLERVVKVVAADDGATLARVAALYERIVPAGVHRAPSIRVAEAAKVIENTQRDVNVALMNEIALLMDRLGLRTQDVLAAAGTKWNFLPFRPGLVGGHCVGVDPYYLTAKAEAVGHHPEVILAGRRINDTIGEFIAHKLAKLLAQRGLGPNGACVGVLGLTFKPDVRDLRNSQVPRIIAELRALGATVAVFDPLVARSDASAAVGGHATIADSLAALGALDALVLAVPHRALLRLPPTELLAPLRPGGWVIDVTSALPPAAVEPRFGYWSL